MATGTGDYVYYYYVAYYIVLPTLYVALMTVYGNKVQFWFMSGEVSKAMRELGGIKNKGLSKLNSFLASAVKDQGGRDRIMGMLDYFEVYPVDMDPAGIVDKLKHLMETYEDRMKRETSLALGTSEPVVVGRAMGQVEAAAVIVVLYKIADHFVSLTYKYSSIGLLQQMYAILPLLVKMSKAYLDFMDALDKGAPVGDGIGPLTVGLLMMNHQKMRIAEDTAAAKAEIKGRKAILVKAEGPANSLGRLDDAVRAASAVAGRVSAIITIDAMLRLESERSGETARGIGVAIGGIGVERFKIEEKATDEGIPLYAIVVKESYAEAVSAMTKDVAEAVDDVHRVLYDIIESKVPPDGTVIIVGVGNTLGVGQ